MFVGANGKGKRFCAKDVVRGDAAAAPTAAPAVLRRARREWRKGGLVDSLSTTFSLRNFGRIIVSRRVAKVAAEPSSISGGSQFDQNKIIAQNGDSFQGSSKRQWLHTKLVA